MLRAAWQRRSSSLRGHEEHYTTKFDRFTSHFDQIFELLTETRIVLALHLLEGPFLQALQ